MPDTKAESAAETDSIRFLCDPELEAVLPRPDRAVRFLPDWFRNLPREMGMKDEHGLPGLTAKACLPMADAMGLGWVIPLPTDVRVMVDFTGENIQFGWAEDAPFQPIAQHHPGQIGSPGAPFDGRMPLKWINPWRVVAPEGYSVLFTPPLNHAHLPFTCLSGLVDCDHFSPTVNFPFFWTGGPGDHTLPRGTPMAQVIALPRGALPPGFEARGSNEAELADQVAATERKYGEESAYAREWRQKK